MPPGKPQPPCESAAIVPRSLCLCPPRGVVLLLLLSAREADQLAETAAMQPTQPPAADPVPAVAAPAAWSTGRAIVARGAALDRCIRSLLAGLNI